MLYLSYMKNGITIIPFWADTRNKFVLARLVNN